ncbi:MAG TPA: hypothetical protein VKE94_20770 [Gemmataceae bacterium]|nr:hypothetical protein [Gemmataceae bacterium]
MHPLKCPSINQASLVGYLVVLEGGGMSADLEQLGASTLFAGKHDEQPLADCDAPGL